MIDVAARKVQSVSLLNVATLRNIDTVASD